MNSAISGSKSFLGGYMSGPRPSVGVIGQFPREVFRYQLTCGLKSDVQSVQQETGDTGMSGERFGEFVRREREAKGFGLREMAKMIGVSPTTCRRSSGMSFHLRSRIRLGRLPRLSIATPTNFWLGRVEFPLTFRTSSSATRRNWRRCCAPQELYSQGYRPVSPAGSAGEGQVTA